MKERLIFYLRYLLASHNRHGVHSPFVYSFLDRGINGHRGKALTDRIQEYFGKDKVVIISPTDNALLPVGDEGAIIFMPDIHVTRTANEYWQSVVKNQDIQLTIDLWYAGVLVISRDFKEKQHFVLRWKK